MKQCPNCGVGVQEDMVLCPSCGIDMRKAAVALGRDYYIPAGRDLSPSIPADDLPLFSPAFDRQIPPEEEEIEPPRTYRYTPTRAPKIVDLDACPGNVIFQIGLVLVSAGFLGILVGVLVNANWLIAPAQLAASVGVPLACITVYWDAKKIGAGNPFAIGSFLAKIPPIVWAVGFLIGWPWVMIIYVYSREDIWQAYLRGRNF